MFGNFGHDNDERCLLKRNGFPVTVEVLFLVSSRKVLSSQTGNHERYLLAKRFAAARICIQ